MASTMVKVQFKTKKMISKMVICAGKSAFEC